MSRLSTDMRTWRAVYRLSQEVAAGHMGVSLKTWARWERGDTNPFSWHREDLRRLLASPPPGWVRDA